MQLTSRPFRVATLTRWKRRQESRLEMYRGGSGQQLQCVQRGKYEAGASGEMRTGWVTFPLSGFLGVDSAEWAALGIDFARSTDGRLSKRVQWAMSFRQGKGSWETLRRSARRSFCLRYSDEQTMDKGS